MRNWFIQILILLLLSAVTALAVNSLRGDGIALVGDYKEIKAIKGEPIVPPSAEEGDPPFIAINEAWELYQNDEITFIDARDPEDFEYGHITRAINIPFDYLDDHWDSVIAAMDPDAEYVVYCSGSECEASLFLGRYMKTDYAFSALHIFYGGWQEWETNELPITYKEEQGEK